MLKGFALTPNTQIRKPQFYSKTSDGTYSRRIPAYRSPRITINVSGMRYETYEETLSNYPDSLLGSPVKRKPFYNATAGEYYFHRDKYLFDAILFYYQSRGILAKPDGVDDEVFMQEVYFYGLKEEEEIADEDDETGFVVQDSDLRRKVWLCLEYPRSSLTAKSLALWSVFVISISTITFCIETLPSLQHNRLYEHRHSSPVINTTGTRDFGATTENRTALSLSSVNENRTTRNSTGAEIYFTDYWFIIEAVCVGWFTIEYFARVWSAPRALKFATSTMGILDMVAIIPFFITLAFKESTYDVRSFAVVRALRLFRVIRIFKLSRYSSALKLLVKTLYSSSDQLKSLFFCFFVAVVLFSSAIYYVDNRKNIPSIPHAFWWCIVTMTSVGYGDMVPTTLAGKFVGGVCAMSGIILFCLPTPVLVSNFIKYYLIAGQTDRKKKIFAENLKKLFLSRKIR